MTIPALSPNADTRSIVERVNRLAREFNRTERKASIIGTDTGTATAYAITPTPGVAVYEVGQVFSFQATHANSGTTPTLNVNALGAGTITYPDGTALVAGDIALNATVTVSVASTTPTFHLLTTPVSALSRTIIMASQVDQETASSTTNPVTPGRQQFHPSAAKFWVNFAPIAGTGTITPAASYNVTSVTDNGTGDFTVTIATDFSSANWAPFVSLLSAAGNRVARVTAQAAGTIQVLVVDLAGIPTDPTSMSVGGFGDQ